MKKTLMMLAATFGLALTTLSIYANHHEGNAPKPQDEMKADLNKDGKISLDEFKSVHEQHLQERFKRQDTNNDGFIDESERNAAKEKWQAHRQAAHDKCMQKAH